MEMLEVVNSSFVAHVSFPVSNYLMNRKGIMSRYQEFTRSEWYSQDLLREIQLRKLKGIIAYANRWIPYYKNKFREIGFSPEDLKDLDDIKAIPPLNRQDVIDNHVDMVDIRQRTSIQVAEDSKRELGVPIPFANFRKHKLIRITSSGSTGAPVIFYEDGTTSAFNWAIELRVKNWFGVKPGTKEMRMARVSTDYVSKNRKLLMRKFLWNQMALPGMNLSDRDYDYCFNNIMKYRPRVFWGITSALVGLADHINYKVKRGTSYRPNLIATWAAPLYDHEYRKLEKVFGCSITNVYGSREVGHVACLCPDKSLHINQEGLYVETENIDGVYPENDTGEILVTTLEKTPMPFIRYRMGDVGEIGSSDCSCGRNLQVMKILHGRTGEVFITKDGRMISPNFWSRTFMNTGVADAFKRFQVIYRRNGEIRIKLVRRDINTQNGELLLRKILKNNFHTDTVIDFLYVENIEPLMSGKYQMVINEMKQGQGM